MLNRLTMLPALAAVALIISGPHTERFETIHGPKLVLLLALAAALAWRGLLPPREWKWRERLLVACVALAFFSALTALSPAYAVRPMLLLAGATVVALGVASADDDERERWLWWLAIAVVVAAGIGALEAAGVLPLSPRGRAPGATMGQRNNLAHFLVLGSPLVWRQALRSERWFSAVALIAAVVVATRSRAAWLVGPLTLVAFVALTRTRRAALLVPATVAGIAVTALAPVALMWRQPQPYLDSLRRLVDANSGSGAGRLVEWRESLELYATHLGFGVGPGNWFIHYGVTHDGDHFAHSDFMAVLTERGGIGHTLWLALGVLVLMRGDALARCTVLAAAGLGVFDAVLQLPAPLLLTTIVCFVGVRAGAVTQRVRPIAVLAAIGAAAVVLSFSSRLLSTADAIPFDRLELASRLDPLDGELRATLGQAYVSAGECEKAEPHVRALRRLIPTHPLLSTLEAACR